MRDFWSKIVELVIWELELAAASFMHEATLNWQTAKREGKKFESYFDCFARLILLLLCCVWLSSSTWMRHHRRWQLLCLVQLLLIRQEFLEPWCFFYRSGGCFSVLRACRLRHHIGVLLLMIEVSRLALGLYKGESFAAVLNATGRCQGT